MSDATAHDQTTCPMDGLLRTLMGPWTTYIVWLLRNEGPLRFSALKSRIPTISSKVLTERLRLLESERLVHRDYVATIPPTVTYSLSARGEELKDVLDMLAEVAMRWKAEDEASQPVRAKSNSAATLPAAAADR
jgi:DNA-binding HxlR family transcriptional regulator